MSWVHRLCCAKPVLDDEDVLHNGSSATHVPSATQQCSTSLAVNAACSRLLGHLPATSATDDSWLAHIGLYLAHCRTALGVADVRYALFSSDSSVAWVISEAGGVVRADGWGGSLGRLSEQANTVGIIRDIERHASSSSADTRPSPVPLCLAPDPGAVVCCKSDQPVHLGPSDLLVLPVRHHGHLTAALAVDFRGRAPAPPAAKQQGSTVGGQLAGAGVQLSPAELADLSRLAQILTFGVLGPDPNHARYLSMAAGYLGLMPFCDSLHDMVSGVLDAVSELLAVKFPLGVQPVLAMFRGVQGSPAVFFSHRRAVLQQRESILDTQASVTSLSALGGGGGGGGAQTTGLVSSQVLRMQSNGRVGSEHSVRVEMTGSAGISGAGGGGGVAGATGCSLEGNRIKAVRMALANTLLSEALRSAQRTVVPAGGDAGPGIGAYGPGSLGPERLTSNLSDWGIPAAVTAGVDAAAADSVAVPMIAARHHHHFSTTILRHASRHVLDEQQPCRDILLVGKMLGGAAGSLVLCLEVGGGGGGGSLTTCSAAAGRPVSVAREDVIDRRKPVVATYPATRNNGNGMPLRCATGSASDAAARMEARVPSGGRLLAMALGPGSEAVAATAAVAAALGDKPTFGLYLMSYDVLPSSVLQAIASECQLLFGLLLDACRTAIATRGRLAAELRNLQSQLADSLEGGASPQPVKLGLSGGKPKAKDGQSLSYKPVAVRGLLEASNSAVGSSRSNRLLAPALAPGGTSGGRVILDQDLMLQMPRDPHRWLMASSPELLLERAPGPSPLEVMVSTMRSHLSAAIVEAETSDEARSVMAQDMAALDVQDLIGRGGQGVVFKGILHGLETAIKVMVCRDGEPLGDEEQDPKLESVSCGVDGRGSAPNGAEADDLHGARLRKVKRGAMEHAITPTLSHPNIVQAYATFTNVVIVKCMFKGETKPRLRLCTRDDAMLSGWANPGPLNQVICLEYCEHGTLITAAHSGAFRPPGASAFSAMVRPALVPLYMSLLEVALALRYLHSRRIAHCDLKPGNVLLKGSSRDPRGWTCKLSDFGCARLINEAAAAPAGPTSAGVEPSGNTTLGFRVAVPLGTLSYMAPECFVKGHLLTTAVDVYSFGIMMFELLTCQAPYAGMKPQDIPRHVLRWHLRPEFHPLAPYDYCSLASRCWSSYPSRRPSASELVLEIERLMGTARRDEEKRLEETALSAALHVGTGSGGGGGIRPRSSPHGPAAAPGPTPGPKAAVAAAGPVKQAGRQAAAVPKERVPEDEPPPPPPPPKAQPRPNGQRLTPLTEQQIAAAQDQVSSTAVRLVRDDDTSAPLGGSCGDQGSNPGDVGKVASVEPVPAAVARTAAATAACGEPEPVIGAPQGLPPERDPAVVTL